MSVRIGFVVCFSFVLWVMFGSGLDGQCLKGCPRETVEEGPVPDKMLKNLIREAETIFVGTVSSVEPAVPVYPTGEKVDWEAYDKVSDQFKTTNEVNFVVDSVWKGEKVDTMKLRGGNLLLIYRNTKKFLVFVGKEDNEGFRLDISKNVFGFVDVNHPDYHWDVDLGKRADKYWSKESFRSNKRLPTEYGSYVMKWDRNHHLWARGDTAYWTPELKKAVTTRLTEIDPRFQDSRHREEIFSLTTLGCQFTKDEWDRSGGSGFIGWQPCPMPISLLEAYVKVLVRQ